MSTKPCALHFGAGNIGRGFVGAVLVHAGAHVVFADVDKGVIDRVNKLGKYTVHILAANEAGEKQKPETELIQDVSGILSTDQKALEEVAVRDLVLITTAVGPSILPKIAPSIITVLRARQKAGKGPINVVACENTEGATTALREAVMKQLREQDADKKLLEYAEHQVGWADSAVDRIVPVFEPDVKTEETSLDVGVEPFYEWDVDERSLKVTHPDLQINGILPTDRLESYIMRKLYTLNTGHAITSYLGYLKGYDSISEAICDPTIEPVVAQALKESGAALRHKYGFPEKEHAHYRHTIIVRFKNPNVPDSPQRVGRQPLRKLQPRDRLLGPMTMCRDYGLSRKNLIKGVAAALLFRDDSDDQAKEVAERISSEGVEKVVVDLLSLAPDHEDVKGVVDAYNELQKKT
ncbi:mannitol dehydrogenase C-terminal domain-containing protein [Schizophyllum amplum]|uniref:Mannitol-1-phosphate 5-dehydrogenase n=1 Tax=Schizophyllum amplum TaxID=97359 RepID=A0A550CJY9_9AGAR|nr:mannitol dehydrogenase C-terminal domain-containing protein [Auriculariopsis ampla]